VGRWWTLNWWGRDPVSDGFLVRKIGDTDRPWVSATLESAWGSVFVARRGELLDASSFGGFIAEGHDERLGLAIVVPRDSEYEVLSLSTTARGRGVGRALLEYCFADADARGCRRVWLTTTNDNVAAIAFYQRVGMDMCALYRNAVDAARKLKPSIPTYGTDGIPMRHELEFERVLAAGQQVTE
jgi:ribosomal protein S18 acetylase RimI-like enzyme